MQLREIYIDGFGIFTNKRITGLVPGINIIYGKNEFGKSSVSKIEFCAISNGCAILRNLFLLENPMGQKFLYKPSCLRALE